LCLLLFKLVIFQFHLDTAKIVLFFVKFLLFHFFLSTQVNARFFGFVSRHLRIAQILVHLFGFISLIQRGLIFNEIIMSDLVSAHLGHQLSLGLNFEIILHLHLVFRHYRLNLFSTLLFLSVVSIYLIFNFIFSLIIIHALFLRVRILRNF
jgi:hypothetical protein